MDEDTIFINLLIDEQILGKFRHSECCNSIQTICILTNHRLLIRWKQTLCCCFHQSFYSSISLKSIDRIDETSPNRYYFICSLIILIISIISIILGSIYSRVNDFIAKYTGYGILIAGIPLLNISLIIAIWLFSILRKKYVTIHHTSNKVNLKFKKSVARDLEMKLSEAIYMTKLENNNQISSITQPIMKNYNSPPIMKYSAFNQSSYIYEETSQGF
ncbi:hypothetical protein I4U23_016934 [Adineta vaga]|nr:hypothetical protein I4U23_016934 [Adineta vaga]